MNIEKNCINSILLIYILITGYSIDKKKVKENIKEENKYML